MSPTEKRDPPAPASAETLAFLAAKQGDQALSRLVTDSERDRRVYEAILSSTPDLVYVFDLDHRFTFANAALLQMWGRTRAEALGKNCLELGYPQWHAEMHDREIEQVIANKLPVRGEVPFTGTHGRRIYEYIFVPVLGAEGQVEAVAGTTRDVTERKQAEEFLRQSEERFRALVTASSDLIYSMTPDWSHLRPLKGQVFVSDADPPPFEWLRKFIPPDDQPRVMNAVHDAIFRKSNFEIEHRVRRRDGSLRWMLSRAAPLLDVEGNIVEWFGAARDVTERKQTEEALRESQSLLRTVTNEAQVGLVMVDQNRRYLFANQAYADILGLPDVNLVGQRVPDVLAHLYNQIEPNLNRAFQGERITYELHLARHPKSAEERYYEVVYEPRSNPGGGRYVIVVLVDITERKKVEHTLEKIVAQRTASLSETVGELEAFSYTIAHDMRAPLRAMESFSSMLEEDYSDRLDEQGKSLLRRIALSANRLDHLIQDVLNYSKIVRADLRLEPIDTDSLVHEIIQSYPNLQPERADVSIPAALPAVLGNRAALTQAVANLLGNAAKFVAPGTRPHIEIRPQPADNGYVRLVFADNGIGIDPAAQKNLFQMFQRAHHPGAYEGTGMGLAIVRKAVERMGGYVGVESKLENGSRFWIELKSA